MHRSKIDSLQLAMVFREKLLKSYSYEIIYNCLVEDLKILELGLEVEFPYRRSVKCGLLCYPADNLEVWANLKNGRTFYGLFVIYSIFRPTKLVVSRPVSRRAMSVGFATSNIRT